MTFYTSIYTPYTIMTKQNNLICDNFANLLELKKKKDLHLAIFCHSSPQIVSRLVRWTAIFRFLWRCSIGL